MQAATANEMENFRYVWDRALEGLFIDRMDQNQDIFARFMNNPQFKGVVSTLLMQQVYDQIRAEPAAETGEQTLS